MAQLSRAQVQSYAAGAGFSGSALSTILAISQAESGFNTVARGVNTDGSVDRGLYQINNRYHPEVSDSCAYDPVCSSQAAFRISNSGRSFTPWSTYTSGAYRQYLIGGSGTVGAVRSAAANTYPRGQCTWWADERCKQLTGYYVPWSGNARDWITGARAFGWNVSSKPVKPSIIVLQPGVQGADSTYGHVGVVERINADGSVTASNQNWAGITWPQSTNVTFTSGPGIAFVYAGNGTIQNTGGGGLGGMLPVTLASGQSYTSLLDQVHATLIDTPGFYGLALAIDEAEQFPGWVDLTNPSVQALGVPMDITGWIRSVGATMTDNAVPFLMRGGLISLGLVILVALILRVVLDVGQAAAPIIAEAI